MVFLHFLSKTTCSISTFKISQDGFTFSENYSVKHLSFFTLLQSPFKSLVPGNAYSNGGDDVWRKSLKTAFKTLKIISGYSESVLHRINIRTSQAGCIHHWRCHGRFFEKKTALCLLLASAVSLPQSKWIQFW